MAEPTKLEWTEMRLSEFDYDLPPDLIAQHPKSQRTSSKLMVLLRKEEEIVHEESFTEIAKYLKEGDLLVVNSTKVIPAKLLGKRQSGAKVEILVTKFEGNVAEAFVKTRKRPSIGEEYDFGKYQIRVTEKRENHWLIDFGNHSAQEVMTAIGISPLPPYIKRKENILEEEKQDKERYQTVYANTPGAIAAPTAGLHFSNDLLNTLQQKGVDVEKIVLHVGLGTFLPVKAENIQEHKMHSEEFEIQQTTAHKINQAIRENRRIVCVGTTSCRALESSCGNGIVIPQKKATDIFIYPGYSFKIMQGLVTNFHLPKSTLLMLVSAFANKDFILKAYKEAVDKKYNFFSYGDAMFIM